MVDRVMGETLKTGFIAGEANIRSFFA